jgi:transcription elongation factor Elf1
MKKLVRTIRQVFNEMFGWNCPECKSKRSVFFYDLHKVKHGKFIEVYKCKVCNIEGYKT